MQTNTAPPIVGVHHTAFRCRDAAETRRFYEGILGLPLAAALDCEKEPGTGVPRKYMHLFFELGDGSYVAFFDLPETAEEKRFKKKSGFNLHIAYEVASEADLKEFQRRFADNAIENHGPIDHGMVKSIYAWDPNGIQIEITWREPAHDTVMAGVRDKVDAAMKAWDRDTLALKTGKVKLAPAASH